MNPAAAPTSTSEDRLTFGLSSVGWEARGRFGEPTRAVLDPVEPVARLAEVGLEPLLGAR